MEDELNLKEFVGIFVKQKVFIILFTIIFSLASLGYAISIPNKYKSTIVLASAQSSNGSLGNLASQYGGLAAIAGINLGGGESSDIEQAIALLKSWPFLDTFISENQIKPLVLAADSWDPKTQKIIFDKNKYIENENTWRKKFLKSGKKEPTSYFVYTELTKFISVAIDNKTGLVTISVEHVSPVVAHMWVKMLKNQLNQHFQARDSQEADKNIQFLEHKLNDTSVTEMRLVLFNMLESQIQTKMLAEVNQEYLLKTVVPAMLPEEKSSPKRSLIVLLGTITGFFLSAFLVFIKHLFKP